MTVLGKSRSYKVISQAKHFSHPTFTCSKLTTETIKQRENYVQSSHTRHRRGVSSHHPGIIVNFEQVSNLALILGNICCKLICILLQPTFTCSEIHLKEVRNMFKVNNKDTRTASFDVVQVSSVLTLSILHTLL